MSILLLMKTCFEIAGCVANSVDPDRTPRSAASDLGLHCLLRSIFPNTRSKNGSRTSQTSSWIRQRSLSLQQYNLVKYTFYRDIKGKTVSNFLWPVNIKETGRITTIFSCHWSQILTLKAPVTTAADADNILKYMYFVYYFQRKYALAFHMNQFTWNVKPYFLRFVKPYFLFKRLLQFCLIFEWGKSIKSKSTNLRHFCSTGKEISKRSLIRRRIQCKPAESQSFLTRPLSSSPRVLGTHWITLPYRSPYPTVSASLARTFLSANRHHLTAM